MKKIDLDNWNRREHFEFFSRYEEPFFGIVTDVDCTLAWSKCKTESISFFSYYLHKVLVATNKTEAFRYRIIDNEVVVYDTIHASSTIGREDGTFGFSFIEFDEDFEVFNQNVKKEIKRVLSFTGLGFDRLEHRDDVIHFSPIPWIKFTGLTHARMFSRNDSVPKISIGKVQTNYDLTTMPVSINAHHGLMDGYHASLFLNRFQDLMNL